MYEFQEAMYDDFSGGVTDFYIGAPRNRAKELDNLLLDEDGKPFTRDGRVLFDDDAPRLPSNNQRVHHLFRHPAPALMAISEEMLSRYTGSVWEELTGPSGNAALSRGGANFRPNHAIWKNHSILTNQDYSEPVKVYQDENGDYQIRAVSMPSFETECAIDLANDLRAKYNSHIADAAQHTSGADLTNDVTAAAAHDEATLLALVQDLIEKYDAHEADAELGAGWSYHAAQEASDHSLADNDLPRTVSEAVTKLLDLKTKFNAHDNDGTAHAVAGSYQVSLTEAPTITGAGAANYLYRFYFSYRYWVGDVLHEDNGATLEVEGLNLSAATRNIAGIPEIDNGSTRNIDTTSVKIKIARTIDGGADFYVLGEVDHGTTTFVDTVTDADLVDKPPLYTSGGVLDNDPAPRCKFVVITNDTGWYFGVVEGQTYFPTRWRASKKGSPFSCPAQFSDDLEDSIEAAAAIGNTPIVWTGNDIFRLEGAFDGLGRGDVQPRRLPDPRPCVSQLGIVKVPGGLVFPSKEGFCFTDGQRAILISGGIRRRYKHMLDTIVDQQNIVGHYDPDTQLVYWHCQTRGASLENDYTFVLDFSKPISEDMPFTSMSGTSWAITAMCSYEGDLVMGDKWGFITKFDELIRTDPRIESAVDPADWVRETIIWNLETVADYLGSKKRVKGSSSVTIHCRNTGNIGIQVSTQRNLSNVWRDCAPLRHMTEVPWGTEGFDWGDSGVYWGVNTPINRKRNVQKKEFRFDCRQLRVTNAFIVVAASDNLGNATLDATAKTLTLNTAGKKFPTDSVDYYIKVAADGYVALYQVQAINVARTVLTLFDPMATLVSNATEEWQLHGFQKRDFLHLIDISYFYAGLEAARRAYKAGDSGENA